MEEIALYKFKDINLRGATVINGFPTTGLVSTITANYLIGALDLDQIAVLDSQEFPPVSMIYETKPKFPARIYADEKAKIVVFLSEFTPDPHLVRPLASIIFRFCDRYRCSRIIAPEIIPEPGEVPELFGIGSTEKARSTIAKLGMKSISHGIISGISGILLNEGRRRDFDVISLVAHARPGMPDARAAAMLIETINRIVDVSIDSRILSREVEKIENRIMNLREQSKTATGTYQDMYI